MKNCTPTELDQTIAELPAPRHCARLDDAEPLTTRESYVIGQTRLMMGRVLAQVCVRQGREEALHDYSTREQFNLILEELARELPLSGIAEIAQEVMDGDIPPYAGGFQ